MTGWPLTGCREGYEEGISTTHKVLSAAAFVSGDNPVEMLGQYTTIAVEGPNSEGEQRGPRAGQVAGLQGGRVLELLTALGRILVGVLGFLLWCLWAG